MYFERRLIFRLRESEYHEALKFIRQNPDIESISHLIRVSLVQYIRNNGPKKEIIIDSTNENTKTHKEFVGINHNRRWLI